MEQTDIILFTENNQIPCTVPDSIAMIKLHLHGNDYSSYCLPTKSFRKLMNIINTNIMKVMKVIQEHLSS